MRPPRRAGRALGALHAEAPQPCRFSEEFTACWRAAYRLQCASAASRFRRAPREVRVRRGVRRARGVLSQ
eukprot:11161930-Lingulodinium_polyedra.AAC.1